jgi:predicted nucleic acid-binding protein
MIRVYPDACMVIDLVEGEADCQDRLAARMRGNWIVGSELLRMESRIKALREQREDFLARYEAFFGACQWVDLDRPLFERATALRIRHRLKTPDALHLAAALQAACDEFWTNDRRLADAARGHISLVTWDELWPARDRP